MIDLQINTQQIPEQIEELKTAALMLAISIFAFLTLLVVGTVLLTRWWMS